MIIIPLLLSMGLDMTLPEFEPTTDISGNYIVGSYDVSSDEIIVEEFEDNPIVNLEESPIDEDNSSVADSLSVAPVRIESNFLRSQNSTIVTLENSTISGIAIDWSTSTNTIISGSNGYYYVTLQPNIEYTVVTSSPNIFFTTSFNIGSSVAHYPSSDGTFTPSTSGYLFVRDGQTFTVTYVSSEPEPEPEPNQPYDDTNLLIALNDLRNKIRALVFVSLMSFLYPIAISIKSNIVGGDK